MLLDAALRRPEGAAIHQPRATPWEPVMRGEQKPCKGVTRWRGRRVAPLQGWHTPHRNSQGVALGYRIVAPLGRQIPLADWYFV
jgi:hypothetical protein